MDVAALVISIVALVVAVMAGITVFQMIFGKPKIKVSFDMRLGYKLSCQIRSVPPSKFLSRLGVDRRIIDIDYEISISDMDDNLIEWMLYSTTSSKNVVVPIAEIKNKDYSPYEVCIKDQSDHFGKILGVGSYLCELVIWDSKDNIEFQKHRKHFKVNAIKPFVEWMEKEQYVKTQDN